VTVVRAVSEQAPRVAGKMKPQHVSNKLWGISASIEVHSWRRRAWRWMRRRCRR
jgi:hypothetical protein